MYKRQGVVGAGTMGQGIANAFATAGNQVTVDVYKRQVQDLCIFCHDSFCGYHSYSDSLGLFGQLEDTVRIKCR